MELIRDPEGEKCDYCPHNLIDDHESHEDETGYQTKCTKCGCLVVGVYKGEGATEVHINRGS